MNFEISSLFLCDEWNFLEKVMSYLKEWAEGWGDWVTRLRADAPS